MMYVHILCIYMDVCICCRVHLLACSVCQCLHPGCLNWECMDAAQLKVPSCVPAAGDPRHRTSAHQDGVDAQPLGARSDHGDGGGGSRPPASHHQRGPHRLPNVRHAGQHGLEDCLLWKQVRVVVALLQGGGGGVWDFVLFFFKNKSFEIVLSIRWLAKQRRCWAGNHTSLLFSSSLVLARAFGQWARV